MVPVITLKREKQLIINRLRFIYIILFWLAFEDFTHIARHTFATTVTFTNGVPIESVSKMLGHTKSINNPDLCQGGRKEDRYGFKLDNKPERTMRGLKLFARVSFGFIKN